MDMYRLKHSLRLAMILSSMKRAEYIKKKGIFYHMGENCSWMSRKIPLYPRLISIGNNVWFASNVTLATHDAIHNLINYQYSVECAEKMGCIKIEDNCFIGANTTILNGVKIGKNTIIGANSLVNRDLPSGKVWGGVPAKCLGDYEAFVEKRMSKQFGKTNLSESISENLIEELWREFESAKKNT